MRCGAQRPHMHVELVGQDLKRHSVVPWPFPFQRPRLADDSLRRWSTACIPSAERFERDTESRRALRLGQAELRSNFPQGRGVLGHRHDDAIRPPLVGSEWTAMKIRWQSRASRMA